MDLADVDLVDLDRFAAGFPHDVFRVLRDDAPVCWHPPTRTRPTARASGWCRATPTRSRCCSTRDASPRKAAARAAGGGTTSRGHAARRRPGVMLNMHRPAAPHGAARAREQGLQAARDRESRGGAARARARAILDAARRRGAAISWSTSRASSRSRRSASARRAAGGSLPALRLDHRVVDYSARDLGEQSDALARGGRRSRDYGRRLIARNARSPATTCSRS